MRENRAPAPRPPRALLDYSYERRDAFDLADTLVTIGGEEIRLGDLWNIARIEAEISRHG
jgi:hypothetical protein